jgi:hypothetical protein
VTTTGGNDTITVGNGDDTVTAVGNVGVHIAGYIVTAGNGNDTITLGHDSTVTVGNGNDTITIGSNSTVTLGTGNDLIIFGGTVVGAIGVAQINGFSPQNDVIQISSSLAANFAALSITESGGNAVITVDAHDIITLQGVANTSLTASDFHFV